MPKQPPRKKSRNSNSGSSRANEPHPTTVSLNQSSQFSSLASTYIEPCKSVDWSRYNNSPVGWRLYFPEKPFQQDCGEVVNNMKTTIKYFQRNTSIYGDFHKCLVTLNMNIQLHHLQNDQLFQNSWPNFEKYLIQNPTKTLATIGLAIYQLATDEGKYCTQLPILPRMSGPNKIVGVHSLVAANSHKLCTIRGSIVRLEDAKLRNTWVQFDCNSCAGSQLVRQPDGKYTVPRICLNRTCMGKLDFVAHFSHHFSETIQHVRVQEIMSTIDESNFNDSELQVAMLPSNIDVELKQDLVDVNVPGDDVTVTAILRVRQEDRNSGASRKLALANNNKFYLEAVNVVTNTNKKTYCCDEEPTEKDHMLFKVIKQEPQGVFRLLVHSLCPRIYGNDMIKAGLLLGMFGGDWKTPSGRRAEIHVLIIGDPGLGKSKMLQACVSAAPRGIFVSGCTSTVAGLTVAVHAEKGMGTTLEAGALVMADQGICCIDEFDKMSTKNCALLQAMESQKITICKANIQKTVVARTTILAAGNPVGGHYNKRKTVAENVKLSPALLSRFDLIFIMLDRPNVEHDRNVINHIKPFYQTSTAVVPTASSSQSQMGGSRWFQTQANTIGNTIQASASLMEHLRIRPGEKIEQLPHPHMQKYILNARKTCHPKLTKDAMQVLKEFYLELRQMQIGRNVLPVTTRQLEALCRLTIARARIDMCSQANVAHANDVRELVRHSMIDVFSTDTSNSNLAAGNNATNDSGTSAAALVLKFGQLLRERARKTNKRFFTEKDLIELARNTGFKHGTDSLADMLITQGVLRHRGSTVYQLL